MKTIYSLDQEKEIWSFLGLYESKKYVETKLKEKYESISQEEMDVRTNIIVFCIRQAREFFSSAKQVTLLTSPLLLSYGMLNLGKAMVYYKSPLSTNLGSIFQKHGLAVQTHSTTNSVNDVTIKFQNYGAYHQMASIYEEPRYSGIELPMSEILSQIPDIYDLYLLVYESAPRVAPLYKIEHGYSTGTVEHFAELQQQIEVISEYSQGTGYWIDIWNSGLSISRSIAAEKTLLELGLIFNSISGRPFLRTFPKINKQFIVLNEISIHYLIIFTYGMLSRYNSTKWGMFIDKDHSSEAEIIDKSTHVCTHRFLHLMLNLFFEQEFDFKTTVEYVERGKRELVDYIFDDLMRRMDREKSRRGFSSF